MKGQDKQVNKEQITSLIGQRRTHMQRILPYQIANKFSCKHDFYTYLRDQLVSHTYYLFFCPNYYIIIIYSSFAIATLLFT